MKRVFALLFLIAVLVGGLGWAFWSNQTEPADAMTTPRLSVQVCWPTVWGDRPNAIAWTAPEEYVRPAPGSTINPPSAVSHSQWYFDRPVNILWNYGSHIQAVYGDDVPRDVTVVTAMWSPTSGGFRYVGQVNTNTSGIVSLTADLCSSAPAPAPAYQYVAQKPEPAHPAPVWMPIGPRYPQSLAVAHSLKFNAMNFGQQFVYMTITDERGRPVPGARADITVRYPNAVRTYGYGPADQNGQLYIWFDVGNQRGGYYIPIDIVVSYNGIKTLSRTGFWAP